MGRPAAAMILLLLVAGALPATARGEGGKDPGIYPVELMAGEAFDMCLSGEIACPARMAICDDPKIAVPVDLRSGLGFRGISSGTTLCSAASAIGPRRIFRITVR